MACGRPVVASALPGESDIILASQAGLLYTPGDAASLAAHLATLIHDPALRKQMGAQGRAHVVQHHSWDRVAAQTETAMKAALQHLRT
jgi:glycosyltransferase involved in cell wall biosynthesis